MRVALLLTVCLAVAGCQRSGAPPAGEAAAPPERPANEVRTVFRSEEATYVVAPDGAGGLEITPHDWTGGRLVARPRSKVIPFPRKETLGKIGAIRCEERFGSIVCVAVYAKGPSNPDAPRWLWHWFNGEEWRTGKIDAPAKSLCAAVHYHGRDNMRAVFEVFREDGKEQRHGALIYDNPCMSIASDEGDGGWFHPAAELLDPKAPKSSPLAMPTAPEGA